MNGSDFTIRETTDDDLESILDVERRAFGSDEEALLVRDLLSDPTARPSLSLLALLGDAPVGHILFTAATLEGASRAVAASILAPLAVVPEAQGKGCGGRLIEEGIRRQAASGVELVFVLGHPGYYPRFRFNPAGRLGLEATYPISEAQADAWMVQALAGGVLDSITGKVLCADTLDRPEYWIE